MLLKMKLAVFHDDEICSMVTLLLSASYPHLALDTNI